MKTININLLPNKNNGSNDSSSPLNAFYAIDQKTRKCVLVILLSTGALFILSLVTFLSVISFNNKYVNELNDLTLQKESLEKELASSNLNSKALKEEKEILVLKEISYNKITNKVLPWHNILASFSTITPRAIKIREMTKNDFAGGRRSSSKGLCITGDIYEDTNPLNQMSFLTMNMNEDAVDSYFYSAEINNVNFDETEELYKFKICSKIKKEIKPDSKGENK